MADNKNTITQIYRISIEGMDDSIKKTEDLTAEIVRLKDIIREAKRLSIVDADDAAKVEVYSKVIAENTAQVIKLTAEKKIAEKEIKNYVDAQAKLIQQQQKEDGEVKALQGSYNALYQEYKELNKELRATPDTAANFNELFTQVQALQTKIQDFNRQFTKDKTLVGEYTTGILQAFKAGGLDDLISNQRQKISAEIEKLDADFVELRQEISNVGGLSQTEFDKLEKKLVENRQESQRLTSELERINTSLKGVGGIGTQVTSAINNGFKDLKSNISSTLFQFIGFNAAFNQLENAVTGVKDVADVVSELEVNMGLAAGGADDLVEKLKGINTRTTLQGLLEISDVALKAGVSNENLAGVTEAIDKVKVAFGKDFGSVEQGTETFAKLINIFFKDGQITGERITFIGNAIRTLANETTASVPFLTDFSGRMAGVRQISNTTLPDVIGLGAGFEQFKQSSEVASTALVKVIPKLATDIDKYAKILGVSADKYKELIQNDPTSVLIGVAEKLVKSGKGITDVAKALGDSELGAGRITTILATLGGNAEVFRTNILKAGKAFESTGSITDAFARKNENLGSVLDKVKKQFADVAGSKTFQTVVLAIATAITFLLQNLYLLAPIVLYQIGLTDTWVGAKLRLLAVKARDVIYTGLVIAQMAIYNSVTAISTTVTNAYAIATGRATAATIGANIATRALAATMAIFTTPIGIMIGLVIAFTTAIGAIAAKGGVASKSIDTLRKSEEDLRREKELGIEISKKSNEEISGNVDRIKNLTSVVNNLSISEETRRKALQELIAINPEYVGAIQGEKINLEALNAVTNTTIATLERFANVRARVALRQELINQKVKQEADIALQSQKAANDKDPSLGGFFRFVTSGFKTEDDILDDQIASRDETTKKYQILSDKDSERIKFLSQKIEANKKIIEQAKKDGVDLSGEIVSLAKRLADDQKELSILLGGTPQEPFAPNPTDQLIAGISSTTGGKKGKSPKEIRDEILKRISDKEAIEKAALEKARIQKGQYDGVRISDEETYLKKLLDLNVNFGNQKLDVLRAAGEVEKRDYAETDLEIVKSKNDTNQKLFEIESKKNKDIFEEQKRQIKLASETPDGATDLQKAEAKLKYYQDLLAAQEDYNVRQDALEDLYKVESVKNEKERTDEILELNKRTKAQLIELDETRLRALVRGVNDVAELRRQETEIATQKALQAVYADKSLSNSQKQQKIKEIEYAQTLKNNKDEQDALQKIILLYQLKYGYLALANKEYRDLIEKLQKLKTEAEKLKNEPIEIKVDLPNGQQTFDVIRRGVSSLFGFKEGSNGDRFIGQILSETYDLAKDAMNAYFDAERARVEESRKVAIERIDLEKKQLLDQAQSQAERDSIERQAAKKKRQADKEAGEELKRIKKNELDISLATELANIAVSAAANPLNAFTFGGAGIAMYAALAALAFGRYAIGLSKINSTKFSEGGSIDTNNGGPITGRSHATGGVRFNYEAEGGELAIVNKRAAVSNNRYIVSGTPSQIASGINWVNGGVNFRPGARISQFADGGFIGRTRAPIFVSSRTSSAVSESQSEQLMQLVATTLAVAQSVEAVNGRIDRLKVYQVINEVTAAQTEETLRSEIGVI